MRGDEREGQGSGHDEAGGESEPVVTRELAAEAAVWIARLHSPSRSKHLERECLTWQASSAAHRLAFERCTDLWMDVAGIDRAAVERAAAQFRQSRQEEPVANPVLDPAPRFWEWQQKRPWIAALTVSISLAVTGVLVAHSWRDSGVYGTNLGEQRLVVLPDGTRMSLNTSTRVRVNFEASRRSVSVEGGEALFEVAKDASRPFVVHAAGREVTATGTAFLVRLVPSGTAADGDAAAGLEVTLVEGQVVVQDGGGWSSPVFAQPIVMVAGDRVRVRGTQLGEGTSPPVAAPQMDRPRIDQMLAWKRGEAVFDDVSLRDALAEMNRYSAVPLTIDAGLGDLRISGQYRTGDNAGFARAIATLHGLEVRERAGRIELAPRQ